MISQKSFNEIVEECKKRGKRELPLFKPSVMLPCGYESCGLTIYDYYKPHLYVSPRQAAKFGLKFQALINAAEAISPPIANDVNMSQVMYSFVK